MRNARWRCWGHGSDHQSRKMKHMNTGRSRQGSLLLQKGAGTPKSAHAEQRTLPYLSLMRVIYLSGQGAQSSQLANLKHTVSGRRGREGGWSQEGISAEPEQNGVTKISFDRKDIMLCSTPSHPMKNPWLLTFPGSSCRMEKRG